MTDHTSGGAPSRTQIERTSGRELVVRRTFNAPREIVFRAWSDPEIFKRWWVPRSFPITLTGCEMDVRTGGTYKLVFTHPDAPEPAAFYGRYLEVEPPARIVWTNEEAGEDGQVTTATFEEIDGRTLATIHDRYPSRGALDEALETGSTNWNDETFGQLDEVLEG